MSTLMIVYLSCIAFSLCYFLTRVLFCSHKVHSIYCYYMRKLWRIPQPVISREQAIEIAMNSYNHKHCSMNYPNNMNLVKSKEELRYWIIFFSGKKPRTISKVDNQTGKVSIKAEFPR